ncbi:MAG: hypothetical protein KDD53_06075 [Bdellovibrionales bacterium]|nr:hypothetical protein [Bdellovibrionales bacterium]
MARTSKSTVKATKNSLEGKKRLSNRKPTDNKEENIENFKIPADEGSKEYLRMVESVVTNAFSSQREFLIHSLTQLLVESEYGASQPETSGCFSKEEWTEIESMSRLRSTVGGRFQNLKERWLQAGFPLREHRGDKDSDFKVDDLGWIELSNWISKQGYEVRLCPDKANCLFEIRQRG